MIIKYMNLILVVLPIEVRLVEFSSVGTVELNIVGLVEFNIVGTVELAIFIAQVNLFCWFRCWIRIVSFSRGSLHSIK